MTRETNEGNSPGGSPRHEVLASREKTVTRNHVSYVGISISKWWHSECEKAMEKNVCH